MSACTSLSLPSTRKRKKVCSDSLLTKSSPSLETRSGPVFAGNGVHRAEHASHLLLRPPSQLCPGSHLSPRPECLLVFAVCWNWAFSAQRNHLHPSINNFMISKIWLFFIVLFFFTNPYHNAKSCYFHLVGIQERIELNYVSSQYCFTWTSLFYLQRNSAVKILLGSSPILD